MDNARTIIKPKTLRVKTNYMEVEEKFSDKITEVLEVIPFTKFSIPLFTAKDKDKKKMIQVGYIKNYNKESKEFYVALFNSYRNLMDDIENPKIIVDFGIYENEFTKINRLVISK